MRSRSSKAESAEASIMEQAKQASMEWSGIKYCITEIGKLLELFQWFRTGCQCKRQTIGKWNFVSQRMEGHGLVLDFQCSSCGIIKTWKSSSPYPDGSLEVNRDVARAWMTTGGERGHYFKFTEALRCGQYSPSSFDATVKLLRPIILEQEDHMYRVNINEVNMITGGPTIGLDCQHCRSQRATGAAPYATTTVICHTLGPSYGKILLQKHVSTHQLKESGMSGKESKDKYTVDQALRVLVEQLVEIKGGLCDGSSSANKSWKDIVIKSKKFGTGVTISNCFWHKCKGMASKFNSDLVDKKIKLKEKDGRKQYENLYPEFDEMGLSGKVVKNHFIHSQKTCNGDPDKMAETFESLVEHYDEEYSYHMQMKTRLALESWLKNQCKDLSKYCQGLRTDLEESFHRVALKYWKKGTTYAFEEYITRRALAALDWNENFGKAEDDESTSQFRTNIGKKFHEFLMQRSVGRRAEHQNLYIPKSYGVTDYY
jgi:hypothetical protein